MFYIAILNHIIKEFLNLFNIDLCIFNAFYIAIIKEALRLKSEIGLYQKKTEFLLKDIKDHKEQINQLENEQEWDEQIENLKRIQKDLDEKLDAKDETISSKDDTISALEKKHNELEKFKFVLDDKMAELMFELQPQGKNIEIMEDKIKQIDQSILHYNESNSDLEANISSLEDSITTISTELSGKKKKLQKLKQTTNHLKDELYKCSQVIQDPIKLKETLFDLYNYIQERGILHNTVAGGSSIVDDRENDTSKSDEQLHQQIRQEELKMELKSLNEKYATDSIALKEDIKTCRNRNQKVLKNISSLVKNN